MRLPFPSIPGPTTADYRDLQERGVIIDGEMRETGWNLIVPMLARHKPTPQAARRAAQAS